jgi:dual specificity MAP kinase phosphatase
MATIAIPRPIAPHRSSSPLPHVTTTLTFENLNTSAACPIPIPNKHLPVCPPGPSPAEKPDTPPASPPSKHADIQSHSLLYPPDNYHKITSKDTAIYTIDARGVAAALDHLAGQPLPDPCQVFPWLHGLHPHNHIQQAFFVARRRTLRRTPKCFRGLTLVKAGGDLSCCRLKGAIAPEEFMHCGPTAEFKEIDPREGFSVRNFQIQAAKVATVSDIIIYGEDEVEVRKLAWNVAGAQQAWRETHERMNHELPHYNTFICITPFEVFESNHPEIVATNSRGQMTGNVMDFFHQERVEMWTMTKASEIARNVWLGPTPDITIDPTLLEMDDAFYDILIECCDSGRLNPKALQEIAEGSDKEANSLQPAFLEFPSSGSIMPPSWSNTEADGILETCKWLHYLANGNPQPSVSDQTDSEGDSPMPSAPLVTSRPRRILIHCTDGYTETSMLALSYYIYSTGATVSEAWLQLHTIKKRNFFAYPPDVSLLKHMCPRLLAHSPGLSNRTIAEISFMMKEEPRWLSHLDGSLPSRILDYMYLGNLAHANNPELLRAMGIGQILSVGEMATWRDGERQKWGDENICVVKSVQDNGVDPLTDEFDRCLAFIGESTITSLAVKYMYTNLLIDRGRRAGTATLVHCRVGVSRSATICIAEVMQALNLSYPRAYCFVRARRLNVIIQPHLRFSYELLKWEETLQQRRGQPVRRELEWMEIAREIAAMNRPYSR